jgi:hypothetical protein
MYPDNLLHISWLNYDYVAAPGFVSRLYIYFCLYLILGHFRYWSLEQFMRYWIWYFHSTPINYHHQHPAWFRLLSASPSLFACMFLVASVLAAEYKLPHYSYMVISLLYPFICVSSLQSVTIRRGCRIGAQRFHYLSIKLVSLSLCLSAQSISCI